MFFPLIKIKQDIPVYNTRIVGLIIEDNKGVNMFRERTAMKKEIIRLKNGQGNRIENREEISRATENFLRELYRTKQNVNKAKNTIFLLLNITG